MRIRCGTALPYLVDMYAIGIYDRLIVPIRSFHYLEPFRAVRILRIDSHGSVAWYVEQLCPGLAAIF